MNRELDHDHRSGPGRQQPAAGRWPVLAQLPRLGEAPPQAPPRLPTFTVREQAPGDLEVEQAYAQFERAARGTHYTVDPPHASHVATERAAATTTGPTAPPARRAPAAQSPPRYRIDPPSTLRPGSRPAPADPDSLPARMYRLHEKLSPHLGIVGAVAMVIGGSVLYWLALGRHGGTFNPSELLEFNNTWSHDSPLPTDAATTPAPTAPVTTQAAPAIDWNATPHVADATAAESPAPVAEPASSPAPSIGPALTPPAASPTNPPSLEPPATTTTAIPPGGREAITPTPHGAAFPATPYPAYSYDQGLPNAVSMPAATWPVVTGPVVTGHVVTGPVVSGPAAPAAVVAEAPLFPAPGAQPPR